MIYLSINVQLEINRIIAKGEKNIFLILPLFLTKQHGCQQLKDAWELRSSFLDFEILIKSPLTLIILKIYIRKIYFYLITENN